MARKLRGFERVLDAPALFAVAYGEIASSLYIALGIVAAAALGLTPLVLLLTGVLFFVVSLSYAEGTAAIPEAGGAATFVRRAFNDLAGFVTGWVLFLDFLIVMALSALFAPHYLGEALSIPELRDEPWDAVVACILIASVAGVRLARRTRLRAGSLAIAVLDLVVQGVLVLLGLALVLSPETLTEGLGFERGQDWSDVAFALPLAMLAYTGLETVANLAEETREPGRALPRSLFSAIGLVVLVTVLIAAIGLSAFPAAAGGETALGEEWLEAPLVGIVHAFDGSLPAVLVDVLRISVGISGAFILLAAATTSVSGITRLSHSLAEHGSLPRALGRFERRALVSSEAILLAAGLGIGLIVLTEVAAGGDPGFLAATYSFGILVAFVAAQLAVIRLRMKEPGLVRPFVARPNVAIRGHSLPLPALVGAPVALVVWILALATHDGARYAGPAWLALGLVVFVAVRRSRHAGLLEHVEAAALPAGAEFGRILVPMKIGDIGEEMVATAIALAKERGAQVEAITVVRVPRRFELEGDLPADIASRVEASLEEARLLGEDHGVEVRTDVVRARSIGHAIVEEAKARNADVIVLGSSPRWRRESRFFSPTVDLVLRNADCEVLVVAFPEGAFEGQG